MTHGSQRNLADVTTTASNQVRLEPIGESRDDCDVIKSSDEWELARKDVVLKEKLGECLYRCKCTGCNDGDVIVCVHQPLASGEGAFGEVWRGVASSFTEASRRRTAPLSVAVKFVSGQYSRVRDVMTSRRVC